MMYLLLLMLDATIDGIARNKECPNCVLCTIYQGGVVPGQLKDKAGVFGEGSNQIATIANRAYIDQGFQVLEAYRQAVGESNFRSTNFAASAAAQQEINAWVDSVTRGLIKNLIPE